MVEYKDFFGKDTYIIESCWEEIGIQLEVDYSELKVIRGDYHDYGRDNQRLNIAFREMISHWLKQENPPPTWSSFAEALERVKFQEFADHLRSKYVCVFILCILYSMGMMHAQLTDEDFHSLQNYCLRNAKTVGPTK